ncbi:Fis family transcriptional regulator [Aliamphritea spongicola]|uniref:Fis family transcriptional regulator n=1 Tax=Aliamphritea spongicola TaxID=707589 RepID=UPI00196B2F4B|nr:Fis family transcriptional regulator [Aliamphritea spongicola]MBN3563909.1 Fis family transcriptional regulator [Aliamphritea spongicola]
MRKTDKKLDNQICKTLTVVCETALEHIYGFQWLTHRVNYQRFPASLKIACVFSDESDLERIRMQHEDTSLRNLICDALADIGIQLAHPEEQIYFDSEEACEASHQGNWARRLG